MDTTTNADNTARMTDAERMLERATEIAKRTFQDPSEETVMEIWRRLCWERDMASPRIDPERTLH